MGTRASPLSGYLLLYTQFLSRCVTQGSKFRICISSCWLVLSHGHLNYNLGKTEFRKDVLRKPPLPPFYHLPQLENSVILKSTFFSFLSHSPHKGTPTFLSSCTIFLLLTLHPSHPLHSLATSTWLPACANSSSSIIPPSHV